MMSIEEDKENFDTEFYQLLPIAKLYEIDLHDARDKHRNHGEFGADENDIKLDLTALIHDWQGLERDYRMPIKPFVIEGLLNWGYETDEINKVVESVKQLA